MSFNSNIHRIGFCCKWMHSDQTLKKKELKEIEQPFNGRATTISWLNRQTTDAAYERLWEIMEWNTRAYQKIISKAADLPAAQRMVRLGSDVLPAYTEENYGWNAFWKQPDVIAYCEREFKKAGDIARKRDVRVSMHPGQFCVLASDNPEVRRRSIQEFEFHVDVARWMGYGQSWMDMKINVHISGKQGPDGVKAALQKMSPEARNTLTIENEEMAWGLDSTLELADTCALVLDIHHHWVREGKYIQPNDDRVKRVVDSWRGQRPTMHYSLSREDYLVDHPVDVLPDMQSLLAAGYKKAKLRAHSDMMWNTAANDWAVSFLPLSDIMIEAKCKNLASSKLAREHVWK